MSTFDALAGGALVAVLLFLQHMIKTNRIKDRVPLKSDKEFKTQKEQPQ
ncbi:hypothetical protein [Tumebacillus flagellatus]|nr:hypothetical protein [Tumebacillus flagellatus]